MHLKLLAKKNIRPALYAFFFAVVAMSPPVQAYVKFSNKTVDDWDSLFTQSGADKYYTVQRGDTLYEISRALFGDPDFWPKIWSLNSKITNPHLIEKGQVIYFLGGTSYMAPTVGIGILKPESYTYGNRFLSPEIPPAAVTRGPIQLPKTLPNLFRAIDAGAESSEIESISAGNRAARNALRVVEVTSEITNAAPTSVGTIERVFTGADYAVLGDIVYIKVFSGAQVGDELSIYRTRSNWLPLRGLLPFKANLVEWLGTVKVKSTAEGGYTAEVVYANDIIQTGENLAVRKLKSVELPRNIDEQTVQARLDGKAKIVGSHKVAGSTVVGEHQIVYLNSGSSSGIEEGGVYAIYTNFGETGVVKGQSFVPKKIGYIKIATVESSVATGVAFNLISEVQVDQRIGL